MQNYFNFISISNFCHRSRLEKALKKWKHANITNYLLFFISASSDNFCLVNIQHQLLVKYLNKADTVIKTIVLTLCEKTTEAESYIGAKN